MMPRATDASTMDPLGNTTTYTYDACGMTSTTNALNQTTTMTYDDEGRVCSVTDPLNNTTQYEYVDATCGWGVWVRSGGSRTR